MERLNNPSNELIRVLVVSDIVPDEKRSRDDLLRVRVDTQKNQTEDGEKFIHGVESTPVGSGVQISSETSSCYLVGLSTCRVCSLIHTILLFWRPSRFSS